mmetsp:Transcript_3661/g.10012  ORF Transcript_3661/g.10012 Transcript_3661/m.10012 type:complete len:162 (+) Transcript_3661:92-577(+)|eukprot:CAMPEP_0119120792 /NCGR_PEP_ID=MMETSP1310-20130426/1692_1 /TAXON_ID=464262 /ORGANISM="Genus nov. species nov., Strain RCC2339" /LENGTH=161 /DNA_ID=CAMNT_0007110297 /DNA_START=80 /DNA_END=565 /DNA_ORIENTATION=-
MTKPATIRDRWESDLEPKLNGILDEEGVSNVVRKRVMESYYKCFAYSAQTSRPVDSVEERVANMRNQFNHLTGEGCTSSYCAMHGHKKPLKLSSGGKHALRLFTAVCCESVQEHLSGYGTPPGRNEEPVSRSGELKRKHNDEEDRSNKKRRIVTVTVETSE